MKILCVFGRHNYGTPCRGEGYEYTNFLPTLRRLGHEVAFFESRDVRQYRDFSEMNFRLLRQVEEGRPDLVFAVLTHFEIWLETWQVLRDSGMVVTVNWGTDDSWRYYQFSRLLAPAFHAWATTYPRIHRRYLEEGIDNVHLTQWGANAANLQAPLRAAECGMTVSFVGSAYGKRRKWIKRLKDSGIEVACFGHGWPSGPVPALEIPKIVRNSIISLNFSGAGGREGIFEIGSRNQIKARTFEVPAAGGFLLTEWAEEIDRYYKPGGELGVFRSFGELEAAIRYYLAHPEERNAIAQAGYERTRVEHTYDQRLSDVLDFALIRGRTSSRGSGLSSGHGIDLPRFEKFGCSHRMTFGLRMLRAILVATCSMVWGRDRGQRAARRLVFELSWRLVGAKTYSAAGWPGRMFYPVS